MRINDYCGALSINYGPKISVVNTEKVNDILRTNIIEITEFTGEYVTLTYTKNMYEFFVQYQESNRLQIYVFNDNVYSFDLAIVFDHVCYNLLSKKDTIVFDMLRRASEEAYARSSNNMRIRSLLDDIRSMLDQYECAQ